MTETDDPQHRAILHRIARRMMIERGFRPDFSSRIVAELERIRKPVERTEGAVRDLTQLLWCSIDNDESRDLDQLTVAEELADGAVKVLVAIADVDALVDPRSALDDHARHNTTSVYTPAAIFSMIPEKLSNDFTSLGFEANRLAVVVEMEFAADLTLTRSDIYRAAVRNHAKLAYNSVAAWLDGKARPPRAVSNIPGLDENLKLQDGLAKRLKANRHAKGALSLETLQAHPVFEGSVLKDLAFESSNRAKDIIEDFMIAANSAVAQFLASRGSPSIRRVVRTPKDWNRIVEIAAEMGTNLPKDPDPSALEAFLASARTADPVRFPDLSLSIIKLIGPGEYIAEAPGSASPGHFGLAVEDYTHATAPNRRYPDLTTQRLVKAALEGERPPFGDAELDAIAKHSTEMADAAKKVERQVVKSAAALLLLPKIGRPFTSIVTGASNKGTWVRLLEFPAEGKLVRGFDGKKVGQRLRVKLVSVDVNRGFIDFETA
jgi:exoribonuclease-2